MTPNRSALLGLLLLANVVLLGRAWEGGLHKDPLRWAAVGKTLAAEGDWAHLRIGKNTYAYKPPLVFWLTAAAYRLGGVSAWGFRVWGALAGVGAVMLLALAVREVRSETEGVLAGLILLLSSDFLKSTFTGRLDTVQLLGMVLALYGYLRGIYADRPRAFLWIGIGVGLATITKLGIGFVALLAVIFSALLTREWRLFRSGSFWCGIVLGIGVVAGVYILMIAADPGVWDKLFSVEALGGIAAESGRRAEYTSRLEMAEKVFVHALPWSVVALGGIWHFARERARASRYLVLLLVWSAAIWLTVTVQTRLYPRYFLPLMPAVAALAAAAIMQWLGAKSVRGLTVKLPLAALAVGLVLLLLPVQLRRAKETRALRRLAPVISTRLAPKEPLYTYRDSDTGIDHLETAVYFYCDRPVRRYHYAKDIAAAGPELVLSEERWMKALRRKLPGYEVLGRAGKLVLLAPGR